MTDPTGALIAAIILLALFLWVQELSINSEYKRWKKEQRRRK